ncbi:MAG: M1 family metallopeptidase [Pseudomonadota bacterium]
MAKPYGLSWAISLALLLAVSASSAGAAESVPSGKLPAGATPTHYQLELTVIPSEDRFQGRVKIDVTLDQATRLIWLHGRDLAAEQASVVTADGTSVPATFQEIDDSGYAKLQTERPVGPGDVSLVIDYSAPFNQSPEGLFQVTRDNRAYAYTQFQPLRARRTFPSFDEPRFKTPFDIAVTVAGDDIAISNAPERETEALGEGRRRVVFETTAPLPTYLIALAVGDFDVVEWDPIPPNAQRTRPLPLRGIAAKGKGGQLAYALEQTAAMLAILEDYFGSPYPYAKLDIVAVENFGPGGMENAGAIFYRPEFVLFGDAPSIFQLRGYAYIHAHELAHSWFGNLVTPAWWDDLWLNEAFATWMADRVVHAWRPEAFDNRGPVRGTNRALWSDRLGSARQIRQPIESDHDVSNAFDIITYTKGGSVLAMIEQYLGREAFRDGVRLFMARHGHGVATAEDFFAALSESAQDPDVLRAFRSFVEQPGTPRVQVDWRCDASGGAEVTLKQSRGLPPGSHGKAGQRWSIPLCLAYPDDETRHSRCLVMGAPETTVSLDTKSCPAWILPNEQGAAYLTFTLPEPGWDALIADFERLAPSEALALVGSVGAAYEAGLVDTSRLIAVARQAARSRHWDVARAPMADLRELKVLILPREQRPAALALLRDIYRPTLAQFDLSDAALAREEANSDRALLRAELLWFLALDAEDPALHAQLSRLAQAAVGYGGDGAFRQDVLHPNLLRAGLIAGLQEVGLPFAEFLIARLQDSDDAVLRNHILRALAFQTNPALVQRVWELILDPDFPRRDASRLLRHQGDRADNREVLFDWIVANHEAITQRLPRSHLAWLPWRAWTFCDLNSRDRVEAFFGPHAAEHQGGPRALANVLEAIEICAAVQQAQRADAVQAVAAGE